MSVALRESQTEKAPVSLSLSHFISSPIDDMSHMSDNARAGACRLPPELTSTIFLLAQSIWPPQRDTARASTDDTSSPRYASGWMTVLHVCAVWRNIALSAPTLWRNIDILSVHPDSAQELLARSAGSTLHLTFDTVTNARDKHTQQAFDNWLSTPVLSRLESLIISGEHSQNLTDTLLSQERPSLRKLCVIDSPTPYDPFLPGLKCPQHLCQLFLMRCTLPSDFPLFTPSLTHLKLTMVNLAIDPTDRTPTEAALSILSRLTSLEYIKLYDFPRSDGTSTALGKIMLPARLRYVEWHIPVQLKGTEPACVDLLDHVSIPPTTPDLHVFVYFFSALDHALCRRVFNAAFADVVKGGMFRELELRDQARWCLYHRDAATHARTIRRSLNFQHFRGIDETRKFMESILSACPHSLVILSDFWEGVLRANAPDLQFRTWADVFQTARDVRRVEIYYRDLPHLWRVLSDERGPLPLPRLEAIVLGAAHRRWVDVTSFKRASSSIWRFDEEAYEVSAPAVGAGELPGLARRLSDIVLLRRQDGAPIREVRMEGELAEWDCWDAVRDIVDVVAI